MSSRMKNKLVLIAVALPLIVISLLIARAEYDVKNGEQWNFELRGYDPRDLLRGHYLRFNLLYDWQEGKNSCISGSDCCLCLSRNETPFPAVHKTSCTTARNQCDGFIASTKQNVLNRYYIPEQSATRAEKLLAQGRAERDALLSVSINSKGEPVILDLIINGQSIDEILKQKPVAP